MKIIIRIDDKTLAASLSDNEAARAFAAQLPLKLTLKDYAATEKIADLPKRLPTDGAPMGYKPSSGGLTYYAPWGNLAIFYKDFEYSRGLVPLGKIELGLELLKQPGPFEATIERQD